MPTHDFLAVWKSAGPGEWFSKSKAFDATLRAHFLLAHENAAARELVLGFSSAESALTHVLLLDQFPRHAFRGTARMYATDALARHAAARALAVGFDETVEPALRLFFYLPFAHSERLEDQERSVRLHERLGYTANACRHHDIIRRFGRFPHRNPLLGRRTTTEEQAFLEAGGFAG